MTALSGIRVLDASTVVMGPYATRLLADLGADVLKLEPPEGDTLRAWRTRGVSTTWKALGRNKLSVCLDLRGADGVNVVRRLARDAPPAARTSRRIGERVRSGSIKVGQTCSVTVRQRR